MTYPTSAIGSPRVQSSQSRTAATLASLPTHLGLEGLVDFLHGRELTSLGLLPLGPPAFQLAGQVGLSASEISQTDLVGIEPV
jgi:hypothetical protein